MQLITKKKQNKIGKNVFIFDLKKKKMIEKSAQ